MSLGFTWDQTDRGLARKLSEHFAPLGSRSALSPKIALIVIPIVLAAQVYSNRAARGGEILPWLLSALVGYAAMVGGLMLGRRIVGDRDPGVVAVLGIFTLVGLARSLISGAFAVAFGLSFFNVKAVVLAGIITGPALLILAAVLVSHYETHRSLVEDLRSKREVLLETERTMDAELERITAELAAAVRDSLQPAIDSLDRTLADVLKGGSPLLAATALEDLVQDEIRPLSHRLVADDYPSVVIERPRARSVEDVSRVPIPSRFAVAQGIRPLIAAVAGGAAVVAPAFNAFAPLEASAYVIALVSSAWVALAFARRALRRIELPTPLALPTVVATHVLLTRPFVVVVGLAGILPPPGTRVAGPIMWVLIGALTFMTALVDARRTATEAELATVVEGLADSVAMIRRRVGLAQRHLARVLHGDMQGSLYAAAMRLSSTSVDAGLIESVRRDIEASVSKLKSDSFLDSRANLHATLEEILGTWDGQRAFTVNVNPQAEATLANDPDVDQAVAVVVQEAITNALRHGHAQTVEVAVKLVTDDPVGRRTLAVRVSDDGCGWADGRSPGLGSALFDEFCSAWSHTGGDSGTTFTGSFTLAA